MTVTERILTIAVVVLGTVTTRFLPFAIFPEGKKLPDAITAENLNVVLGSLPIADADAENRIKLSLSLIHI